VVPREAIASWGDEPGGMEVLKAQAVAAGTYAAFAIFHPRHGAAAVCTTTHCQVWTPATDPRTDRAVQETAGAFVTRDGEIIQTEYSSSCGGTIAGCPCVELGKEFHGHGRGMCQWGAYRLATAYGKTWRQILQFYYPQGDWGEPPSPSGDWASWAMRGAVTVTLGGHEFELPIKGHVELREEQSQT